MKRVLALLIVAVLALSMLAGCGGNGNKTPDNSGNKTGNNTPGGDTQQPSGGGVSGGADVGKYCLIVTGGTLGDQANNDGLYGGMKKFADETGAQFDAVELAEVADIDMTVRTMANDGYTFFAFNSSDGTDQMDMLCPDLPNVTFVMFNGTNAGGYDNLVNITTETAGAAFMCGIFATLMNEQLGGERVCGYIGGVRNPNLERARYGMQAAAELLGGKLNSAYVGSFTDAATAKEIAQQMQREGVRIIQAWGGGANKGVFEAAETAGEGYYSMGAATGQYHMSDTIIASLKTDLEGVMYDICTQYVAGTLSSGTYEVSVEGGRIDCMYAPDGRADIIPAEVTAQMDEYRQKLIAGELFAPSTEEEYNQFVSEYLS